MNVITTEFKMTQIMSRLQRIETQDNGKNKKNVPAVILENKH